MGTTPAWLNLMAKKASNRSVYLPDETWARVVEYAFRHDLSVNGAVRALVEGGTGVSFVGAKPAVPEKTLTPAASPETVRAAGHILAAFDAQVGPIRPPPGSRLKKARGA